MICMDTALPSLDSDRSIQPCFLHASALALRLRTKCAEDADMKKKALIIVSAIDFVTGAVSPRHIYHCISHAMRLGRNDDHGQKKRWHSYSGKQGVIFSDEEVVPMNMRVFGSILLFGLFLAGCTVNSVDDAGITARIKTKLAANDNTSSLQIGVDTKNGYVTLSGVVPTDTEKATAEEIAKNTEGVKAVTNVMKVDPNVIGATNIEQKAQAALQKINQTGVALEDAGILTEIKAQFIAKGILGTDVDVNKGDVTITGELESARKKAEALAIVKRTKGVKSIKNQLTVKKG